MPSLRPSLRTSVVPFACGLACVLALAGRADAGVFLREVQLVAGGDFEDVASLAVSPVASDVYALTERDGLFTFSHDSASGALLLVDREQIGVCVAGTVGSQCARDRDCEVTFADGECLTYIDHAAAVAPSPDGACVYTASSLGHHTIVAFARDPATRQLDAVGHVENETCLSGLTGAACSTDTDCDTAPASGDGVCLLGLRGPRGLAFSPDGTHLYVTTNPGDAVFVFRRPAPGCELELVQHIGEEASGGLRGLHQAFAVAVDGSGEHVYVASGIANSLLVFDRDAGSGMLTLAQALIAAECTTGQVGDTCGEDADCHTTPAAKDGTCVVSEPALISPSSLAFPPGETQLYVGVRSGVTVLERNPVTGLVGSPAYSPVEPAGFYTGTRALAVAPDGAALYAGHGGANATLVFEPLGGGVRPVSHAPRATTLAVSSDSALVYGGERALHVYAVEPTAECSPAPLAGCRGTVKPGKSVLQVADRTPDTKDKLVWKWAGEATDLADLGDPTTSASFALCVYDASAAPQPLLAVRLVPGGDCAEKKICWSAKPTGFKYKSKVRVPDGIEKAVLKAGIDGKAKLLLKGKGERLALAPLGVTPPLEVQLQRADGPCWGATYGSPTVNSPETLKARSD